MRRVLFLLLITAMLVNGGWWSGVLAAQAQGPDGWTNYNLKLRAGPGTDHDVITVLASNTPMIFEARSEDRVWLLGQTDDGALRGWVAALYFRYRDGFAVVNLPVSSEVLPQSKPQPAAPADEAAAGSVDLPDMVAYDDAGLAPLANVPLITGIGPNVAQVFAYGQSLGNQARVFTEVGECNSLSRTFMNPFSSGEYNLGPYQHLQATIDFFRGVPVDGEADSFAHKGVCMSTGFTALAAVDPTYADPAICPAGLSLLACELERTKASVVLVHLGLYDVYWLTPSQYETGMRQIIETATSRGVIPVLFTFPTTGGDSGSWPNEAATRNENRVQFNLTLLRLSQEYGVPLVNFWRATRSLPNGGLRDHDWQHLSEYPQSWSWADFTGQEQIWGFTMFNLVALQALHDLHVNVLAG